MSVATLKKDCLQESHSHSEQPVLHSDLNGWQYTATSDALFMRSRKNLSIEAPFSQTVLRALTSSSDASSHSVPRIMPVMLVSISGSTLQSGLPARMREIATVSI